MAIIFHLEKFVSHGENKILLLISSIYLLVVALIAGSVALLKFKTLKISKAFDVKFRENRFKGMKRESLAKSQLINKNSATPTPSNHLSKQASFKAEGKFKRRGMRKKTNLNMMMKMAIKREDSIASIDSLDLHQHAEEAKDNSPIIMCVTCDARESDCMLQPCRHAVYCQFCATEIMNGAENKCKLCKQEIEEIFVLERNHKNGHIYILAKLRPRKKAVSTHNSRKNNPKIDK